MKHFCPDALRNAVEGPILDTPWLDANWQRFLVGISDLEVYAYAPDTGPEEAGIYFLMNDRAQYLYCGLSNNISRRLDQHKTDGRVPFSRYCWFPVYQELLSDVERAYIHALGLPYNRYADQERWTRHEEMVQAIRERWGLRAES